MNQASRLRLKRIRPRRRRWSNIFVMPATRNVCRSRFAAAGHATPGLTFEILVRDGANAVFAAEEFFKATINNTSTHSVFAQVGLYFRPVSASTGIYLRLVHEKGPIFGNNGPSELMADLLDETRNRCRAITFCRSSRCRKA